MAFERFGYSYASSLAVATLVAAALWPVVEHAKLGLWLAAIVLIMSARKLLTLRYRRMRRNADIDPKRWKLGFSAGAAAAGACWGLAVFIFPVQPFDQPTILLMFVLAGVTAFSVVSMSSLPSAVVSFTAAALAPLMLWLLMHGERFYYYMGAITLVYLVFAIQLSRLLYRVIRNSISLSARNSALSAVARESEARYRQIADHSVEGIFLFEVTEGVRFRLAEANPAFEHIAGVAHEVMVGRFCDEVLPPVLAARMEGHLRRCLTAGVMHEEMMELDLPVPGCVYSSTLIPVRDADGCMVRIAGTMRDITRQKKADDALRENEAFLNSLLDSIPIPVFYKDRDGRYLGFNRAYETFFGKTRTHLIGKSVHDVDLRDLAGIFHAHDAAQIQRKGLQQYESQVINAYGDVRDVVFSKAAFVDAHGAVRGIVGAVLDITERKRGEELSEAAQKATAEQNAQLQKYREELELQVMERMRELEESRAQLRGLAARREEVREEERKHIAREIHDELGQILSGLQLNIGLLNQRHAVASPALAQDLQETTKLVSGAIGSVRNIAASLRSFEADLGFDCALRMLVERFVAYTGIRCEVEVGAGDDDIAENHAVALYRIVQESLTNIAKHAQAKSVCIVLNRESEELILVVRDDGRGFDTALKEANSFGLIGIRERTHMLGGTATVDSRSGAGTEIVVCLPV
jgi:PAS domain S-box-containing protein